MILRNIIGNLSKSIMKNVLKGILNEIYSKRLAIIIMIFTTLFSKKNVKTTKKGNFIQIHTYFHCTDNNNSTLS